jgi:hypothetical protein
MAAIEHIPCDHSGVLSGLFISGEDIALRIGPAWGGIKSCAVTPGSLAAFAAIGRVCGAGARLAIAKAKSSNPLPGSAGMAPSRKSKTRNSRPP